MPRGKRYLVIFHQLRIDDGFHKYLLHSFSIFHVFTIVNISLAAFSLAQAQAGKTQICIKN